jgi:hypothetical protein
VYRFSGTPHARAHPGFTRPEVSSVLAMSELGRLLRKLKDRVLKRRGDAGERALKRKAAKAQRLQHERLDDKLPR